MFYSKIANIINRNNLVYITYIYGSLVDMYLPEEISTIRADSDVIAYKRTSIYSGKIFFTAVFKNKYGNLSSLPFTPIDDENSIYSTLEFPLGTLAVFRIEQKIQNYQIFNIEKIVDNDVIYFYRYKMIPYTLLNTSVNRKEITSKSISQDDKLVTDLSMNITDRKLESNVNLTTKDDEFNRPKFIRRIKDVNNA